MLKVEQGTWCLKLDLGKIDSTAQIAYRKENDNEIFFSSYCLQFRGRTLDIFSSMTIIMDIISSMAGHWIPFLIWNCFSSSWEWAQTFIVCSLQHRANKTGGKGKLLKSKLWGNGMWWELKHDEINCYAARWPGNLHSSTSQHGTIHNSHKYIPSGTNHVDCCSQKNMGHPKGMNTER